MAHLATVGSHAVNGVAELHSELLKQTVLRDFAELWPEKFCNVTNGVTPRRFVALSNPGLTELISSRIGDGWLKDLNQLRKLEPLADDAEFQEQWRDVKLANKRRLAALIKERTGIVVVARVALRHSGEAHSRIQAPTSQCAPHPHALSALETRSAGRCAGTHFHLRRQSGARLFHGQAHHQVDHRDRRTGEQRSCDRRTGSRSFTSPTSTSRTRTSFIRRPICPSKSRPRARKRAAPAT